MIKTNLSKIVHCDKSNSIGQAGPPGCSALPHVQCCGAGGPMQRLWLGAGAVLAFLIWWLFFQAIFVLVVFGAIVAGVWIWWEIHALKKAMRTPPRH